ncbi:MAG: murein hydrolase activator EnvC [Vicinamibacterales bacterium]
MSERMRALQRESERLATESRTLLGDLRQLEITRDVQIEDARLADAAAAEAEAALQQTTERLGALEQQREAQLPDIKARLVDIYKRGRGGNVRLLAGADSVRDLARATRAIASLTRITQLRIDEHRRTLAAVRAEQEALRTRAAQLQRERAAAAAARAAAERAVRARTTLIAQIDQRRDLTAQLAGELQVASQRLQQQLADLRAGRAGGEPVAVPLAPFRGALEWPVVGNLSAGFGQSTNRLGGSAVRNGIEIEAPEGAPVRAVHGGTVAYADAFTGFGNLVIVDHGSNHYSLYGYLSSIGVMTDQGVQAGDELGRVGTAPAGPPALYFEMRVDGRSVDPVEWLQR